MWITRSKSSLPSSLSSAPTPVPPPNLKWRNDILEAATVWATKRIRAFIHRENEQPRFTCWLLQVCKLLTCEGMLSKHRNLQILDLGRGGSLRRVVVSSTPEKNELLIPFKQLWEHPDLSSFSMSYATVSLTLTSTIRVCSRATHLFNKH